MTSKNITFLCDASRTLGLGHLMRSLAMVRYALEQTPLTPRLLVRSESNTDLGTLLPDWCSDIERSLLAPNHHDPTIKEKFFQTTEIVLEDLSSENPSRSQREREFLENLRSECFSGAFYNGQVHENANFLIDPYFGAEQRHSASNRYLLGPDYFVFRSEFRDLELSERPISNRVRTLLLSFGGSDPDRLTLKILRVLEDRQQTFDSIRTIVGPKFPDDYVNKLRIRSEKLNANVDLIKDPANMARQLMKCDLAVIRDGLTKYEAAVTGTPSIIVPRPETPDSLNIPFEKHGMALLTSAAGDIDDTSFLKKIDRATNNKKLRESMSKKGRDLLDTRGVDRIFAHIEESSGTQ